MFLAFADARVSRDLPDDQLLHRADDLIDRSEKNGNSCKEQPHSFPAMCVSVLYEPRLTDGGGTRGTRHAVKTTAIDYSQSLSRERRDSAKD